MKPLYIDANGKHYHYAMAHESLFGSEGAQPCGDELRSSKTTDLESQARHSLLWIENVSSPAAV